MRTNMFQLNSAKRIFAASLWLTCGLDGALAQDRLKTMPGYERFERIGRESTNAFKSGALSVTWTNDGAAFDFPKDGTHFRYEIAEQRMTELPNPPRDGNRAVGSRGSRRVEPRPARGRQFTSALSPDGKFAALYHDRNLWLRATNSTNEIAITTDGSDRTRV